MKKLLLSTLVLSAIAFNTVQSVTATETETTGTVPETTLVDSIPGDVVNESETVQEQNPITDFAGVIKEESVSEDTTTGIVVEKLIVTNLSDVLNNQAVPQYESVATQLVLPFGTPAGTVYNLNGLGLDKLDVPGYEGYVRIFIGDNGYTIANGFDDWVVPTQDNNYNIPLVYADPAVLNEFESSNQVTQEVNEQPTEGIQENTKTTEPTKGETKQSGTGSAGTSTTTTHKAKGNLPHTGDSLSIIQLLFGTGLITTPFVFKKFKK